MDRMSTLPTIKCSSCGIDIDILHLADHVCSTAPSAAHAEATPPAQVSPKLERAATFGGPSFSNRTDGHAPSGRMRAPPRIDPNAANKPFRPYEPTATRDYDQTRNLTPLPSVPPKSPFKMNRSVTTPLPRQMPMPSPDLPSNMDCAFPPFPSKTPTPQNSRPQRRDRLEPSDQPGYAVASPLFAPLSPRTNGGENISKRMDTIAPGPFDGRRPSTSESVVSPLPEEESSYGHRRTRTQGSTRSFKSAAKDRMSLNSNASFSSTYSTRSIGLPSNPKAAINAGGAPPPPMPPAVDQSEGIDAFLRRLRGDTISAPKREQTPERQPSQERKASPPRPRRPSLKGPLPPSGFVPRPNIAPPPQNPSRNGSESNAPSRNLQPPPLTVPTYGLDTPSNPVHTPSDSGLSDDSYASSGFRSIASSQSSPPGSVAGHSRDPSKLGRSYYAAGEDLERTTSPESYMEPQPARGPGSFNGPNGPQSVPRVLSPGYSNMPESPMDPAIQMTGGSRDRDFYAPVPPNDYSASQRPSARQPDVRRPKPASKGNCRGCSEPIIGKCVKDSSGRLTGRYHKSCFVCRTCNSPFATAEFYVFENYPYCEHHYHQLNGSLCNSCDQGIEGQYLETDTQQKYHPRCLTCATCRVPLRDDYFEVGSQKYCQTHARRAAAPPLNQLGPGGYYKPRNMQKRRTRLMMMA